LGIDLLNNHVSCEAGIAVVVAIFSAIKNQSALAGLMILGDLMDHRVSDGCASGRRPESQRCV
jgi:hypothetical protein